MYAVTGITGQVGGALADKLLREGGHVRAVLRNPSKAAAWKDRGCEVAIADMESAEQLAAAFAAAEGVFILPPSEFDPEPGYPEARRVIAAVVRALETSRPPKVVCLSTIGADARHDNLLTQRTMMEEAVGALGMPVTFLRPGWFMENALWDVASARDEGVLHSFLQPADRRIAMVATRDVGELAADLLRREPDGQRIVTLEGPCRYSPNDVAAALGGALGRAVRVEIVPRDSWEALFLSQGMKHPMPRMRMLDGFNQGWIDFAGGAQVRGATPLSAVVANLVTA